MITLSIVKQKKGNATFSSAQKIIGKPSAKNGD
jgi:hypothetical protein